MVDSNPPLWLGANPLILASGSQTRADLLKNAGLSAMVIRPEVDERALEAAVFGATPIELAICLAKAKAENVAGRCRDHTVVGADQVLAIDGRLLHKPRNLFEAGEQLTRLQGRTHVLHSAVAIVAQGQTLAFHDSARLTMRKLGREAIEAYLCLAGAERVTSSVGAYQLEGLGVHLFEDVSGDHTTVLGLPLIPLLERLRAMRLLAIS